MGTPASPLVSTRVVLGVPSSPWSVGVACALGAAAVVLAWWIYRKEPASRRAVLVTLRAATAALLVLVFLQPVLRRERRERERLRVALLIDTSHSMSLRVGDGSSRAERVASLFSRSRENRTLDAIAKDDDLLPFTFGDAIGATTLPAIANRTVLEAASTGARTDIAATLRELREGVSDLGGVVLVSDGRDTGPLRAGLTAAVRAELANAGIPVNTIAIGAGDRLRDLAISRVSSDEFAFVRRPVEFEVEVRSTGFRESGIPVTLSYEGAVVAQQEISVAPDGRAVARLAFEPGRVGTFLFRIAIPVLEGDAVPENNVRDVLLRVTRDKIRVLHVSGRPSWDQRFLRRLLKRNPSVDLISFFILRSVSDTPLSSTDELSLIPFPTDELFRDHLPSFDLVIFQNFEFAPYGVEPHLSRIREFVEQGGGFWMIGGDLTFAAGGYGSTAVGDILPVRLAAGRLAAEQAASTDEYRVRVTDAGWRHPVTRLAYGLRENAAVWNGLGLLEGVNRVDGLVPGGSALLVHPFVRAGDGPAPVLAVREAGRGRVMALLTDSAWRWGFTQVGDGGDGHEYETLVWNAIRWLIHDPDQEPLGVNLTRDRIALGESVGIEVRVLDREYRPATGAPLRLEVRHVEAAPAGTSPAASRPGPAPAGAAGHDAVADERGLYHEEVRPAVAGAYRVRATSGDLSAEAAFLVEGGGDEMADVDPNPALLEAIARATGGRFSRDPPAIGPIETRPARTRALPGARERPLWSHPAVLGFALLLLGSEWLLRRRWGYA